MEIEWKKVLLYAIVPAVIAGTFSIAPKLYDIVAEPAAELTYSLSASPDLEVPAGYRRILSIVVSNSGKKPLSVVKANLTIDAGEIETFKLHEDSGLKPLATGEKGGISVELPKLHPGEKFSLSAMVLLPNNIAHPHFTVRSEEVLGKPAAEKAPKLELKLDLLGAALTSFSVFAMATFLMFRRKPLSTGFGSGKQDALFYIPARLRLPAITNEMRLIESDLTYLRMADILLAYGLVATSDDLKNTIKALKALLLIKGIADISLSVITSNLRILEGPAYAEQDVQQLREAAVDVDDQMELRRRIDAIITGNLALLTSVKTKS